MIEEGYVYCLYDKVNNICRIGKTKSNTINCRVGSQKGYYPFPLESVKRVVKDYSGAELFLHQKFHPLKLNGDWFKITMKDFEKGLAEYKQQQPKILTVRDYKNFVKNIYQAALSKKHRGRFKGGFVYWCIWTKSSYDQGVTISKAKTEVEAWKEAYKVLNQSK